MTSARLAALQLPNGGFESIVTSPRGRVVDCNGFTAAIVLRVTRHVPADPTLAIVRERALGYLATCAAPLVPEAFAFWLFQMAGLEPGDELTDLFPGSGAVSRAWEKWCAQRTLVA